MKKLLFIFALVATATLSFGQTKIGSLTAFAGAAGDSLTASVTKSYILGPLTAKKNQAAVIQGFSDLASGTATFTLKVWESLDGVSFPATATDSVTKSHASDHVALIEIAKLKGTYIKVAWIATSATQKSMLFGDIRVYEID